MKKRNSISITILTILMTLLMVVSVFADTSLSYTFSDGSSDEWAQSEIIAINEDYGIAVLDFASVQENKQFSYEVVGTDVFDISAEDLTSDAGDIIDTGTDPIYIIAFDEKQTDTLTLVSADMATGDMMYTNNISLVVEEVKDDMLLFGLMPTDTEDEETQEEDLEAAVSAGTPLLNEDGNVIAIALSSSSAVPVSSFYEDIEDYIEGTEETLDFSALESLISQAAQIDTDDYLDTTDLQIAFVQAKNAYLTATSQEEIDEACLALQEAIDGLEENSSLSLNMTLIVAVIIVIGVIVLAVVLFLMMKKKNKGTTSGNRKTEKKATDFNEIEYEDGYQQEAKDPHPYDTAYRDASPYKDSRYDEPVRSDSSAGGQEQDDYYSSVYRNMLRPREDARSYTSQQNSDRYTDNGTSKNNSGYDSRQDNGYIHQERSDNDIYRSYEYDNSRRDLFRQSQDPYSDDQYKNDAGLVAQNASYDNEPPTSMLVNAYLIRKKTGEKIPLANKAFTLGRGNAHYRITDNPTVGRVHARISRDGVDYILEDLNSMNGTFLNGQKIQRNTPLMDRDSIKLADEEFEFRTGGMS